MNIYIPVYLLLFIIVAQLCQPSFSYYVDAEDVYRRVLKIVDFKIKDNSSEYRRQLNNVNEDDEGNESNDKEISIELIKQEAQEVMDINNINGMVVSIATIHRNMEDTCFALGKSNLKLDQDMSCEKLFQIGSVSKSISSLLGLYAHHIEALDTNEQIRRYFPEYNPHDTGNEGATLQDLLNHLTGLPRHDSIWQEPYGLRLGLSRQTLVDSIQYLQHSSPIRYKFTYNNIMYTVAGEAIAKALNSWHKQNNILDPTELDFSEWIEEVIFSTLNMESSFAEYCRIPPSLLVPEKLVVGYKKIGGSTENTPIEPMNLSPIAAAGGIISNGKDMLNYMKNFIAEISDDEIGEILKNDIDVYRKPREAIALSGHGHGIFDQAGPAAYSYGLNIEYIDVGGYHMQILQHGGNVYGFSSLIAYVPEIKFGIFVNVNQDASAAPVTLVKRVVERILGIADNFNDVKYHINDINRRLLKAYKAVYLEETKYLKFINKYDLSNEKNMYDFDDIILKNDTTNGNYNNNGKKDNKVHRRQLDTNSDSTTCLQGDALQEYLGIYQHPGYGKIEIILNPDDTSGNSINMQFTMSKPATMYYLTCVIEDYYVPYTLGSLNAKKYLPALGIFFTTINGKGSVIDSIVANFGATQGTPNPLVFTKKCKRDGIDTCAKGTPPMGMTWVDNLSPDWPLHFPRRL